MRFRFNIMWLMITLSVCASAAVVFGQAEKEEGESKLQFTAGSKIFKRRPDGTFTNRFYNGVETRHLDAFLKAIEGIYDSKTGEISFYGETAFRDSVRELYADTLIYNENTREALASGSVRVTEGGRTLLADRVMYLKDISYINASGNVIVEDDSTHSTIIGMSAEFNDSTGYGLIIGNPFLKKIDDDGTVMTVTCEDTL